MDTDVIVVGAGAAGLAAALRLAEMSLRVTVLEARDRVGGRVMWRPVGTVDVPAELGAEFIHGDAPETSALLREAGLHAGSISDASWTCTENGLEPADDGINPGDIFERVPLLGADESVESFVRRVEQDPRLRESAQRVRAFVEGFEAADPTLASARSIAHELRTGIDSSIARPAGGYAPLFDDVAGRCAAAGVEIRLNTIVERIAWAPGSVQIEMRNDSGGRMAFRARCAVVTVPVGVLRQRSGAAPFSFMPPLPPEKQMALRGLEMGHVVRIVLAFRTPFWETIAGGRYRDAAFFRCDRGPFAAFWTQLPERSRAITAWAGGPRATAMSGMPERQRITRALDAFGAMFDERERAGREFEAAVTHDWSADPFACGAYSYVATGAGTSRAVLGMPVERTLFFAGEATSTDGQAGTVSGAFASGMRAAREAADAFGRTSARTGS